MWHGYDRLVWLLGPACLLAACGGGGATEEGGGIIEFPPPATPQENGLPYGADGWTFADAEDTVIVAAGAAYESDGGTQTQLGELSFGMGFFADDPTERDAVVTLFGEEVIITDGEGSLANGQNVRITFDPLLAGNHAGIAQVFSYAALESVAPLDPVNGEAAYVFGFLTDPALINGRIAGSVRYSGDLTGIGAVSINGAPTGDPTGTELDGAITINADFAANRVAGNIAAIYDAGTRNVGVNLSMDSTLFSGNTFAGTFDCSGRCASNTDMDAAFYGPNGQEVAGVLSVDTSHEIAGDEYDFLGVGSFVIVPQ